MKLKYNWNKTETKQFYFSFDSAARTSEMKLKQNSWNSCKTVSELFQVEIQLNYILKTTEKSFFKEQFKLYKCNIKQTWKTTKLVLNSHDSPLTDTFIINYKTNTDKSITAKFNEYFVNVGPSLANKISPYDTLTDAGNISSRRLN